MGSLGKPLDIYGTLREAATMPIKQRTDPDAIATKIQLRRGARGLSQTDVSEIARLSLRTIQHIESGGRARLSSYAKVATALGLDLEELIEEGQS